MIILNGNGLNAPTKRHRLVGWMNTGAYIHFHLPHHSAYTPQIVCNFFYIVKLIMFALWLAIVIIFFVWLLIVKIVFLLV